MNKNIEKVIELFENNNVELEYDKEEYLEQGSIGGNSYGDSMIGGENKELENGIELEINTLEVEGKSKEDLRDELEGDISFIQYGDYDIESDILTIREELQAPYEGYEKEVFEGTIAEALEQIA